MAKTMTPQKGAKGTKSMKPSMARRKVKLTKSASKMPAKAKY